MNDSPPKKNRRQFLVASTTAVGGVGVGFAASPFVGSMNPSAKAKAAGADVEVEVGDLEPGALRVVEWRGMPVFILRRTPEMIADIKGLDDQLKDPNSEEDSQQPEYARNEYRSINPEYLVVMGVCTHLGCAPNFRPEHGILEIGEWWKGGFLCPCHQSSYDLAGRVFAGRSPAPLNLPVPPHEYLSDTLIRVGDQGSGQT